MIIDCHGHYTTSPKALTDYREQQIAASANKLALPSPSQINISDDQIRESLEENQLRVQKERGVDLTIFSPTAGAMAHHIGGLDVSRDWARACNDLIHRVCLLYPRNYAAVCQLPQTRGASPASCVEELTRCVNELGFVGCNLNPDPSDGYWDQLPITDRYWYPLYEKMAELDVPAMIHVSCSCNPNFHHTGAHYLNGDTTAFMLFLQSDLFRDFPSLRFVIPHGGGAVPYHWGRYRGLAQNLGRPPLSRLLDNVYFDTCVYHQPGIDLLLEVIPKKNILFASEIIGAVKGIDPETGFHYDDTKRYIESVPDLSQADKDQIFFKNALKVYPRLERHLAATRQLHPGEQP